MLLDINKIHEIVGSDCKSITQSGHLYITTVNVIETLKKLNDKGFNSLTDCFVTSNKTVYLQITNFEARQNLFVITHYDNIDELQNFTKNFKAYRMDMLRYLRKG